VTHYRA